MLTTVVIQAGGESRRMGRNKALVPFLGEPMIARVARRLVGLGDEILVTTNQPEEFNFLGLPMMSDVYPGKGALGGLYTAILAAKYPIVAVVACDMPLINRLLLQAQINILGTTQVDVVIPSSPEGLEPMHAVFRREKCLPVIKRALDADEKRLISWFSGVQVRTLTADDVAKYDPGYYSFLNVNTPEELEAAETLAAKLDCE